MLTITINEGTPTGERGDGEEVVVVGRGREEVLVVGRGEGVSDGG